MLAPPSVLFPWLTRSRHPRREDTRTPDLFTRRCSMVLQQGKQSGDHCSFLSRSLSLAVPPARAYCHTHTMYEKAPCFLLPSTGLPSSWTAFACRPTSPIHIHLPSSLPTNGRDAGTARPRRLRGLMKGSPRYFTPMTQTSFWGVGERHEMRRQGAESKRMGDGIVALQEREGEGGLAVVGRTSHPLSLYEVLTLSLSHSLSL